MDKLKCNKCGWPHNPLASKCPSFDSTELEKILMNVEVCDCDAMRSQLAEYEARIEELEEMQSVLFDGYAVWEAIDWKVVKIEDRITNFGLSRVLDAVVKVQKALSKGESNE